MRTLKVASLFAGCGGTDIGVVGGFSFLGEHYKQHPTRLVYANDFDGGACDLFDDNFSIKIDRKDIRKVDTSSIPKYDILTAGFPCQSFSIVAQNPPRLGITDSDKGTLFEEVCRFLKDHQPKGFICENVKGILSANKFQAFPVIMQSLRNCGYHVIHLLLNAYHYGVPQRRERVFIIGFRDKRVLEAFRPPMPVNKLSVLKDVVFSESDIADKYYFSSRAVAGMKAAKKEMNKGRAQDLNSPCGTVGAHLAKVSLNSTDPVLCLNNRYRRFTPREVARIQSFPDSYNLTGAESRQYKALGNAIPPVLSWWVMKSVVEAFDRVRLYSADEISMESVLVTRQYTPAIHKFPIQGTLFDVNVLCAVSKKPLTLRGTYRTNARNWIVEKQLYNYPVTEEALDKYQELLAARRLVLTRQKDKPLYFSIKGYSIVSQADVKALNYPVKPKHPASTKYILYRLERLEESIPAFNSSDAYIVGKGLCE